MQPAEIRGTIPLGKVDGYGNGHKECPAGVEITLRWHDGPATTIDHTEIKGYWTVSFSGYIANRLGTHWLQGGQCQDRLRELAPEHARLYDLWQRWHLNHLRPACCHQRTGSYDDPEIREQVCPEGYRYGSAWLVEPLPEDVLGQIREMIE